MEMKDTRKTTTLTPETGLEALIVADPEWIAGAHWGRPRPGHPEGKVLLHILDVLELIDQVALDAEDRERLRLVAIVHDAFKHKVDTSKPRSGPNHHGALARAFADDYIDDEEVLEVIELHDEAYNCWGVGARRGDWGKAHWRAEKLIERLGSSLGFYLRFYKCDNGTDGKDREPFEWFANLAVGR